MQNFQDQMYGKYQNGEPNLSLSNSEVDILKSIPNFCSIIQQFVYQEILSSDI